MRQNTVQKYPHKLFLVDACGALLTAVLVGMVLPAFPHYILMPTSILQSLAAVAGVFALYSAACTFWVGLRWRLFLKIICGANILYGCATMILVGYYFPTLTCWDILYFGGELIVIGLLVRLEILAIQS